MPDAPYPTPVLDEENPGRRVRRAASRLVLVLLATASCTPDVVQPVADSARELTGPVADVLTHAQRVQVRSLGRRVLGGLQ
jgi:hypothetical protein